MNSCNKPLHEAEQSCNMLDTESDKQQTLEVVILEIIIRGEGEGHIKLFMFFCIISEHQHVDGKQITQSQFSLFSTVKTVTVCTYSCSVKICLRST